MNSTIQGKIQKIGNSHYLRIDPPTLKRFDLQDEDLIEFDLVAVAPKGKLSNIKLMAQTETPSEPHTAANGTGRNRTSISQNYLFSDVANLSPFWALGGVHQAHAV